MSNISPFVDSTGQMTPQQVDAENIKAIMQEMNRGTDTTTISRRSILAGQLSVFEYTPGPISMKTSGGVPGQIAAGEYHSLALNFINPAQTTDAGQTFLPSMYVDLFIDPPDTSSTDNLYNNSGAYIYPDGASVTSGMAKLNFSSYLRNSVPPGNNNIVEYVYMINNQDSSPHYYWISVTLLFPADGNLASGDAGNYLP